MPDSQRHVPFTSESVTEGHPDKLCDAVADAVLDDVLARDPNARAAIEVTATTGLVLVIGELSTHAYCDVQSVVRRTVKEIGYTDSSLGFDYETCGTLVAIKEQSPDIAMGVDHALEAKQGIDPDEIGAGQCEFIGVADASGLDFDQHFALARSLELNSRYFQRLSSSDGDGGANIHGIPRSRASTAGFDM